MLHYNIKISGNDKKRMWAMISTDDYSFKFISSKFSLTKLVIENSSKTFKLEEEDISSYRTIEKQLELLEEIKSFFEN